MQSQFSLQPDEVALIESVAAPQEGVDADEQHLGQHSADLLG